MKLLVKFLIPIGLGLFAGYLNWLAIQTAIRPNSFIVVIKSLRTGEEITKSHLGEIQIAGDVQSFSKSAVPYDKLPAVLGRSAGRSIEAHDILLFQDVFAPQVLQPREGEEFLPVSLSRVAKVPELLVVGDEIGFVIDSAIFHGGDDSFASKRAPEPEYVGPFRILSVGSRLNRFDHSGPADGGAVSSADVIHVAVPVDAKTRSLGDSSKRLLQALASDVSGRPGIIAIILAAKNNRAASEQSTRHVYKEGQSHSQ